MILKVNKNRQWENGIAPAYITDFGMLRISESFTFTIAHYLNFFSCIEFNLSSLHTPSLQALFWFNLSKSNWKMIYGIKLEYTEICFDLHI